MDKKTHLSIFGDLYFMDLNLPHRRLLVDDSFRMFQTPPQKKIYPSTGCLLLCCRYYHSYKLTCNECPYSYNLLEL